jgi:ribosomal protein S27E
MKNPNPECPRKDCKFSISSQMTTCMYFQPIYDKNGVNINPDANTTSFKVNCLSCGKLWVGKSRLDETTYDEVENDA